MAARPGAHQAGVNRKAAARAALYGVDINPFPLHLAALNLAMRYIKAPSTEVNAILADFLGVRSKQILLTPYTVKTPAGEEKREIVIPMFDAVVGNLTAQVKRGVEPGIYIHFIMHALSFLKEGGRLGMIISDSWLQTDYGVKFGCFLLDHFKVKALIDISARVFPVPLVGTCILLLEKCSSEKERGENRAVFIYLDLREGEEFRVDEALDAVENPEKHAGRLPIRVVKQSEIPRDRKWVNILFDAEALLAEIRKRTVRLGDLFEASYGNATYLYLASKGKVRGPRNLGASEFFYLDEWSAEQRGLKGYVYPALMSPRYSKWFTFTRDDWEGLRRGGTRCYVFMCHKPRGELPESVRKYIEWGETECRTMIRGTRGGGKVCSQALACKEREKNKELFRGWYDLGGVEEVAFFAPRYTQYHHRFTLPLFQVMLNDSLIAFMPKGDFSLKELKALLAYLNSSFAKLYIEAACRTTGGGAIALNVVHTEGIPVPNVKTLGQEDLEKLALLFDRLEAEARRLGGADALENFEKLWSGVIAEIDEEVERILELPAGSTAAARAMAEEMMRRRLSRAEEARPEALKGEEEPRVRPPKRSRKGASQEQRGTLDKFL